MKLGHQQLRAIQMLTTFGEWWDDGRGRWVLFSRSLTRKVMQSLVKLGEVYLDGGRYRLVMIG